jgi:hypothetical protein
MEKAHNKRVLQFSDSLIDYPKGIIKTQFTDQNEAC